MEPPTPILKIDNIQKYEIKDDNGNKYDFSFYVNKLGINFEINKLGEIMPEIYVNCFDLSSLCEKSKIFSLCNSCNEAFEYINELLKQNKISIKKENENINIIMKVSLMMKEQEVIMSLNKKKNNKDDIIYQLCDVIKEMKNEIFELKNENYDLKKRILNIENWKKRKEEEEKRKEEEKEKKKFPSLILTEKNQKELIITKLKNRGKTINSLDLLFRASRDGDQSSVVHNKIDGKREILMIVQTTKELKFGGYTQIGFDSSGSNKQDAQAFLFSIDKNKTYDNIPNKSAIYCNASACPYFYSDAGNYNIAIPNAFYSNDGTTTKKGDCYYTTEDYEINGGEEKFRVKELEYFQINFS